MARFFARLIARRCASLRRGAEVVAIGAPSLLRERWFAALALARRAVMLHLSLGCERLLRSLQAPLYTAHKKYIKNKSKYIIFGSIFKFVCHLTIHTIHDSENDHMYIQVGYNQKFYGVLIFFWNFVRYLPEFVVVPLLALCGVPRIGLAAASPEIGARPSRFCIPGCCGSPAGPAIHCRLYPPPLDSSFARCCGGSGGCSELHDLAGSPLAGSQGPGRGENSGRPLEN